jgi:Fic family protein
MHSTLAPPIDTLSHIEAAIALHPQGMRISALGAALASSVLPPMNTRTLQRKLKLLVQAQRVVASGAGAGVVYRLGQAHRVAAPKTTAKTAPNNLTTEPYVPMSAEGAAIRALVRRPLMLRHPVGYQRDFLDSYQPGVSFYLPEPLRQQLHDMGRTPVAPNSADKPTDLRPAGTYAREMMGRLLIDLSWASSKLEGNTYSRLDTQNLIELGMAAQGKDAVETQMILNHKAAIEMLVENAAHTSFDSHTFQNLHALLSQNLLHDEEACGRLRRRPVDISGTVFHPLAVPQVLEDCFRLMLQKAQAIADPFEQAFFLMVQLPYLQPFTDVNKRVSRIGANLPLIKHNLCPLSFVDVPERAYVEGTLGVYELNQIELLRDVFVWAYERSCQRYLAITQTVAEPNPLKIRYREAIMSAVQSIVQNLRTPSLEVLQSLSQRHVAAPDQDAFLKILQEAIAQLHEGSVARYRLKLSEFAAWQHAQR